MWHLPRYGFAHHASVILVQIDKLLYALCFMLYALCSLPTKYRTN